jgi:cell division protease FtsH
MPEPPRQDGNRPLRPWLSNSRFIWWYIPLILLGLWVWQDLLYTMTVHTIPYSQFKQYLAEGEVAQCKIKETEIVGQIVPKPAAPGKRVPKTHAATEPVAAKPASGKRSAAKQAAGAGKVDSQSVKPKPATPSATEGAKKADFKPFLFRTVRVEDPQLVDQLEAAKVQFSGVRPGFLSTALFYWILPIGAMVLLWVLLARGLRSAGETVMSFGKNRARLVADRDTGVRFADVAGCDEAKYELQEVVDFLKNPQRYIALGARIPKGVLLVGLPGTGKTLLSRAVAGEAGVPFFSLSGSDFVEMFVGVGAARVRDLFEQAKRQAPCIIFIDELDAVGRERGVHVGSVNDEREQTLNQLLVEMDGFQANVGVILLAATNRPEVLDRALLRPGRFDRQVVIDAPDIDGREAILRVHSRGKPLAEDADLRKVAQETPGFSGADLANALNEAALLSARRKATQITQKDLEEAVEKVVAGPQRRSRRLDEHAKRRVAYHEVGHALVAAYSEHADPVHKISIVPRGRAALGYTLQLPSDDQFLLTQSELIDRLKGLLGGRASEEIVFGEISTGAENDLERATTLARQMVCLYGMSETVGLIHCAKRPPMFLPSADGVSQGDCSSETACEIDQEVKKLLDSAYQQAKQILTQHRDQLQTVAQELIRRETLDAAVFEDLLGRKPSAAAVGPEQVTSPC